MPLRLVHKHETACVNHIVISVEYLVRGGFAFIMMKQSGLSLLVLRFTST